MKQILKKISPLILTCVLAGVVLAILAPYGTSHLSTVNRFIYWCGLCVAGGLGASAIDILSIWRKWSLTPWKHAIAQSVTSTIAVTTILLLITSNSYGPLSLKLIASLALYVWVVAMVISGIGALLKQRKPNTISTHPAIYDRLPPKLRSAEIYALAAEDHYVRVITSKGDELILMRLSDAVKETAPLVGLSPHRSWWVAEAGADKVRKTEIALHSSQMVPVSRNGLKHIREAGWL